MTSKINVDTISNTSGTLSLPTNYFQRRIIQRTSYTHRIGWWHPDNTYYWLPGGYLDYRPLRNDTRLRCTINCPTSKYDQSHAISHWVFYIDDEEQGRHCRGGNHAEDAFATEWDVPSWGAGQIRRIGYKVRGYDGNNRVHVYLTDYWDGGGTNRQIPGQFTIEEYTSAAS